MRFFILLFLFALLVSCNSSTDKKPGQGPVTRAEPQPLSPDQTSQLINICNAVDYKTTLLESDEREFVFQKSQKNCGEKETLKEEVTLKIESVRARSGEEIYEFERTDGKTYMFSEIETSNSGNISKICKYLRELPADEPAQSPIFPDSANKALWYSISSSSQCDPDSSHSCLFLIHGSMNDDGNYNQHTKEVLKIRTFIGVNRGHYTMRLRSSRIGCDKGETVTKVTLN